MRVPFPAVVAGLALTFFGASSFAQTSAHFTERGKTIAADIDAAHHVLRYRVCPTLASCEPGEKDHELPIDLGGRDADAGMSLAVRAIGPGRSAILANVPADGSRVGASVRGWTALIALDAAGASTLLFSGRTGLWEGESGARTGVAIAWVGPKGGNLAVGRLDERLRIPGEEQTLLVPEVFDSAKSIWKEASFLRLSEARLASASEVEARVGARQDSPLGNLALRSQESSGGGVPVSGIWTERRPGPGRGEFMLVETPSEVGIVRVTLGMTRAADIVPPKYLYIASRDQLLHVLLPDLAEGTSTVVVDLPRPIRSDSLAFVLDESQASNQKTARTGFGPIQLLSSADVEKRSRKQLVGDLDKEEDVARADEAETLLVLSPGEETTRALVEGMGKLTPRAQERVIRIARAHGCDVGAPVLVEAPFLSPNATLLHLIENSLDACGKGEKLLTLALRRLGPGKDTGRSVLRSYAVRSLRRSPRRIEELQEIYRRAPGPFAQVDLLRVIVAAEIEERRARWFPELLALLSKAPSTQTYELMEPLLLMAKADHEAARDRVQRLLASDPSPMVRTRAAEGAAELPELGPALVRALRDHEPRVREAAVHSLTALMWQGAVPEFLTLLEDEPWHFVRREILYAFGRLGRVNDKPVHTAIEEILTGDPSASVRAAAREVLGRLPMVPSRKPPAKGAPGNVPARLPEVLPAK